MFGKRTRTTSALILTVATVLVALAATGPASAATFTVTNTNNAGAGSLRDAINQANAAVDADTITVPAGHYVLSGNGDDTNVTGDLDITHDVTINGAGADKTTIDPNSGDRAFDIFGTSTAVTMSGITITNGSNQFGSAIQGVGSALTLAGVTLTGNAAGGGGMFGVGTIYFNPSAAGTITITGSTFSANRLGGGASGNGFGGVIEFASTGSGSLSIADSTFTDNSAGGGATGAFGVGAVLDFHPGAAGTMTLTNSKLDANKAGGGGGSANGFGGAIEFASSGVGTLTAVGTSVSGNTAGGGGASAFGVGGALDFHPSTAGSSLSMTNGTVSGNSAGVGASPGVSFGGAVEFTPTGTGNTLPLTNVTIADNRVGGEGATGLGGGLDVESGELASLRNAIVANNTASTGANCNGSITSLDHNLDGADTCGFNAAGDQKNANPQLGALADNGGPTKTQALQKGSPAINAGDNNGCPATDQRGGARPQPPGGTCDIGAYEYGALADLTITGAASPSPAGAGKSLTYVLTATNSGPSPDDASAVKVTDTLPAGATVVSSKPSQGSCSGKAPVTCAIGTLARGASAKVTVVVKPAHEGTAANVATVSGDPTDPNPANNTASTSTKVLVGISGFGLHPRSFRAAGAGATITRRAGARVAYKLSDKATVTFKVQKPKRGRKAKNGKCGAPSKKNRRGKRCTYYKTVKGSFKRKSKSGKNAFRFTGRLRRHKLPPGKYQLVAVAKGKTGNSAPARASFKIKHR